MKVTEPVGVAAPVGGVTVAVKLTVVPDVADVGDPLRFVVVVSKESAVISVIASARLFAACTLPTPSVAML